MTKQSTKTKTKKRDTSKTLDNVLGLASLGLLGGLAGHGLTEIVNNDETLITNIIVAPLLVLLLVSVAKLINWL